MVKQHYGNDLGLSQEEMDSMQMMVDTVTHNQPRSVLHIGVLNKYLGFEASIAAALCCSEIEIFFILA